MRARHSGFPPLTVIEIGDIINALNRAGNLWHIAIAAIEPDARRISHAGTTWTVVMPNGETFTRLKEHGWLYLGVVQQLDGGIPQSPTQ